MKLEDAIRIAEIFEQDDIISTSAMAARTLLKAYLEQANELALAYTRNNDEDKTV